MTDKEREHVTDGTPCWCTPQVIKVDAEDILYPPKKMIIAMCEGDEVGFNHNNEHWTITKDTKAVRDVRFCDIHSDYSSFCEVIECNNCEFYLK